MTFIKRFFKKRYHVSLGSKIGGVFFLLLAAFLQAVLGYYVVYPLVRDSAHAPSTRGDAVSKVAQETGLPAALVDLYAESILVEDSNLLFAPIGAQIEVPFEPLDSALTWGGRNPLLRLQVDGEVYTFRGESGEAGLQMEAPAEGTAPTMQPQLPPVDAQVSVQPVDWGNRLPASLRDRDPFMTLTIQDASAAVQHVRVPAQASFDLVYASRNSNSTTTFTNRTREAEPPGCYWRLGSQEAPEPGCKYANSHAFTLVVVSADAGAALEAARAEIARTGRSVIDVVGSIVFVELLVAVFLVFALGVYRGGLQ
jgi:hypothetical protein